MLTRRVCWRFIRNAPLKVNHTETMCNAVKPWPWNPEVGQTDASLENQLFGSGINAECSSLSCKRDRKWEKQRIVYKCGNWFAADLWHVRVCFRLCGPLRFVRKHRNDCKNKTKQKNLGKSISRWNQFDSLPAANRQIANYMQMCRDKFLHSYKFRHRAAIVLQRGRSNFFAFHGTSGEQRSFSVLRRRGERKRLKRHRGHGGEWDDGRRPRRLWLHFNQFRTQILWCEVVGTRSPKESSLLCSSFAKK